MANTIIQLKRAATSGAVPTGLANGEISLDFFTGNLWFKAANGSYKVINPGGASGTQSPDFGTVNANGILLISAIQGDILTIIPGTGIGITGFSANDTVRIENTLPGNLTLGKASMLIINNFTP